MIKSKTYFIGCVVSTRTEVIKMAPIIFKLNRTSWAKVFLVNLSQHNELLDDILELFNLNPNYALKVKAQRQSLGKFLGNLCTKFDFLVKKHHFDIFLAAGDSPTVFVASLIAFQHHIPFGHIAAGLRSHNKEEPFPEEMNRVLITSLSTWHFAPTQLEKENLIRENIAPDRIFVTGNPIIDALQWVLNNRPESTRYRHIQNLIIVTAHHQANFGENLRNICTAIITLSNTFDDLNFILPVHPNPKVQQGITALLTNHPRIHLLPLLQYDEFVHLMQRAILILTDSGSIQEEAPALHKPVLVLKNSTERSALITEGIGLLIGTATKDIINIVSRLLTDGKRYLKMTHRPSPYGDGYTAERIVEALKMLISSPNTS